MDVRVAARLAAESRRRVRRRSTQLPKARFDDSGSGHDPENA